MAQHHSLEKHCRVYGGRLRKAKSRASAYRCRLYMEELRSTFQVDVTTDEPDIHPQLFGNGCYAAVQRHSTAVSKGCPYHHSVEGFTWEVHTEEECVVRIIHTQGHTFHTDTIIIHLPSGMWTSKLYNQRRGAQQASKEKSWTSLMIQPCSSNCTHKTACEKPPQLCWLHRGSWVHEWSGLHPSMSARLWSAESANWVGL